MRRQSGENREHGLLWAISRTLVFVLAALTLACSQRTEQLPNKVVNYRDAVWFSIPASWIEEDELGVQGTYYEDHPETGTLRVSVMQWVGENDDERDANLQSILLPGSVETLAQGVYLRQEVKSVDEDGESLQLHRWLVALALPEHACRLVVYTHTITTAQQDSAPIQAELAMVDRLVRSAMYSYDPDIPLVDKP